MDAAGWLMPALLVGLGSDQLGALAYRACKRRTTSHLAGREAGGFGYDLR